MRVGYPGRIYYRRRELLATGLAAGVTLAFGPSFWRQALAAVPAAPGPGPYGSLGVPDANGLRLPEGFSSRLVARAGHGVGASDYPWHLASDGAATFGGSEGGWILVSNSEIPSAGGGASAIHFRADGAIIDAARILKDTSRNCAGGATPWRTWLSCEEVDRGYVWECDPLARTVDDQITPAPVRRPALGRFKHEAVAVDPVGRRLYLTEDETDGGFYRFTPANWPDLSAGVLEVATVGGDGKVAWSAIPDPAPASTSTRTRHQVDGSTDFRRGEGIWFDSGTVYLATTDDKRIHAYDTVSETISVVYDAQAIPESPPLERVDNITVSPAGDLFVCEDPDPGDEGLDIGILTPDGEVARFLTATGPAHDGSELCGVVFDPSGTRLYFSSQTALGGGGAIYEVTGPFRTRPPADPPPGDPPPDDPPPDEPPPPPDTVDPAFRLIAPRRFELSRFIGRGLPASVELSEAATVSAVLTARLVDRRPGVSKEPRTYRLAAATKRSNRPMEVPFRLMPDCGVPRMLRGHPSVLATLTVEARDQASNRFSRSRTVRLT